MSHKLRVGSMVYATEQGLGYLAKSFYDNEVIDNVVVVEHSRHPTQRTWYPTISSREDSRGAIGHVHIKERNVLQTAARYLASRVDVMLFFESPFDWGIVQHCRKAGVPTVLMPMYECFPEAYMGLRFDLYLCPSRLDFEYFSVWRRGDPESQHQYVSPDGWQSMYLPVPAPSDVPWKKRDTARVFVHNAGHGSFQDRNGTEKLLAAWRYVTKPIHLIVRSQTTQLFTDQKVERNAAGGVLEFRPGTCPRDKLWDEGDVFVFPESFNGLSLPLQEARASGMLVLTTDRFPNNTWIPRECLIPTIGSTRSRISGSYLPFERAEIAPEDIARVMDGWYDRNISTYSLQGREWATENSWAVYGHRYREVLGELVKYVKGGRV
jgi:hypothetical protein